MHGIMAPKQSLSSTQYYYIHTKMCIFLKTDFSLFCSRKESLQKHPHEHAQTQCVRVSISVLLLVPALLTLYQLTTQLIHRYEFGHNYNFSVQTDSDLFKPCESPLEDVKDVTLIRINIICI